MKDEEVRAYNEMVRQRAITLTDWLMMSRNEWFTISEMQKQFPSWECCLTDILHYMKYDIRILEETSRSEKKMVELYSGHEYESCERIEYYHLKSEYVSKREKWETASKFKRMFLEPVFPYKVEK
jgi:hypothetical protein